MVLSVALFHSFRHLQAPLLLALRIRHWELAEGEGAVCTVGEVEDLIGGWHFVAGIQHIICVLHEIM